MQNCAHDPREKLILHDPFIELCDLRNRPTGIGTPHGRALKPEGMTEMYLASLIRGFAAWRRYRTAVQELAALDDRALADIGLNRTQIRQVAWHGR